MNRNMMIGAVVVIVIVIVAAVVLLMGGGDEVTAEDAESALRAVFEGDADTANEFVCEEQQISDEDLADMPTEGFEVADVSCEKDGDVMNCSFTISVAMGEGEEPLEMSQDLSIAIEDGKLCSEIGAPSAP